MQSRDLRKRPSGNRISALNFKSSFFCEHSYYSSAGFENVPQLLLRNQRYFMVFAKSTMCYCGHYSKVICSYVMLRGGGKGRGWSVTRTGGGRAGHLPPAWQQAPLRWRSDEEIRDQWKKQIVFLCACFLRISSPIKTMGMFYISAISGVKNI